MPEDEQPHVRVAGFLAWIVPILRRKRNDRSLVESYAWFFVLPIVVFASRSVTFYFLDNTSTARGSWLIGFLEPTAFVLWTVALIAPRPLFLTLLKVHAAVWTTSIVMNYVMIPPQHDNIMAVITRLLSQVEGIIILAGDAIVFAKVRKRIRSFSPNSKGPRFVYVGLTLALLGGSYAGVQAWSSALPRRVIAAVEKVAEGRPYCIEVGGRPARSVNDLTGHRMWAPREGTLSFDFHALLVIDVGAGRAYRNWSYWSGQFETVAEHARAGLHLDARVRCKPSMHFALDLM